MKSVEFGLMPLQIFSDSKYCLGCIFEGWKRRKNVKLWKMFDAMFENLKKLCPNIKGVHVDGHQKSKTETAMWNNICDKLAVEASHEDLETS